MDKEKIAVGFIIIFILLVIYIGMNNQKFVVEISSTQFPRAILFYLASRVDYLLIFASLFMLKIATPIKELIAGILFIWALDIVSFPRLPIDAIPTDLSLMANSDYIIMTKILAITQWTYPFAWKFYYIFMPIILVLIAGYTLGFMNFGRRLLNRN